MHKTKTAADPTSESTSSSICLEVVRVLEIMQILKRTPTLDGTIPLRAAQGCKPFLDGNSAGIHLRFSESAMIDTTAAGATLRMTDEEFERATLHYQDRVEQLAALGHIVRGGYWHRELLKGFAVTEANNLRLWTGLLVRPLPGVAILVSQSHNRACPVKIREYVIPPNSVFIPLFLDIDLSALSQSETWLDVELACLTPLQPGASIALLPVQDRPEVGRSFADFYSAQYFNARAQGHNAKQYRAVVSREPRQADQVGADCEIVIAGPTHIHRIRFFDSFATAHGYTTAHPLRARLPYAEAGCAGHIVGSFDGRAPRGIDVELAGQGEALRDQWRSLYGEEALGSIDQWVAYAHANQGPIAEPYLVIQPWLLSSTPIGWSTILESYHLKGLQGMRGVLSSDSYHGVLPLWLVDGRASGFQVAASEPIARLIPAPRHLLKAGFQMVPA